MIHSSPSPVTAGDRQPTVRVAMLTRHAVSVMNRRAVQINLAIAPHRAKTSAVHWPCFYALSLPPLEPLGEGPRCIRQRRTCTTEVIAPIPSVTIICGRYCADSPPAFVLNAPVIAAYSPGVVASIQGQENIQ
jgi:hypothetical protein